VLIYMNTLPGVVHRGASWYPDDGCLMSKATSMNVNKKLAFKSYILNKRCFIICSHCGLFQTLMLSSNTIISVYIVRVLSVKIFCKGIFCSLLACVAF